MSVTPTGPLSAPLANLRTMLSVSDSFQEWVGADSAEEALAKIYLFEVQASDLDSLRPFATLGIGDYSSDLIAGGAENVLRRAGSLWLYLTDSHDGSQLIGDQGLRFGNLVGDVLTDLEGLSGEDTYLSIINVQMPVPPQLTSQENRQISAWWECLLEFAWR